MTSNKHRLHLLWIVACCGAIAFSTACGSDEQPDYLELSYDEFDQSPDSGWRLLAQREDFAAAAVMIETYLAGKSGLIEAQRGYLHFHAGQLWALDGQYPKAIELIKRAPVNPMPADFPQTFNALAVGTLAFLEGRMDGVRSARDDVRAMNALTSTDSLFLEALEHLATQEGKSYYEVYLRRP